MNCWVNSLENKRLRKLVTLQKKYVTVTRAFRAHIQLSLEIFGAKSDNKKVEQYRSVMNGVDRISKHIIEKLMKVGMHFSHRIEINFSIFSDYFSVCMNADENENI